MVPLESVTVAPLLAVIMALGTKSLSMMVPVPVMLVVAAKSRLALESWVSITMVPLFIRGPSRVMVMPLARVRVSAVLTVRLSMVTGLLRVTSTEGLAATTALAPLLGIPLGFQLPALFQLPEEAV